jgi:hypothetical protein
MKTALITIGCAWIACTFAVVIWLSWDIAIGDIVADEG